MPLRYPHHARTPMLPSLAAAGLILSISVASIASAAPRTPDVARASVLKRSVDDVLKIGKSILGSHGKVTPFQIDKQWVYPLALRNEKGSRSTLNFDAKWKGEREFVVYIMNVDPGVRTGMAFQRKGDKKWSSDSNRGKQFRHRDTIVIDGSKNYLAERNFDAGDVLKEHPNAIVLLVEKGLSLEKVQEKFKD